MNAVSKGLAWYKRRVKERAALHRKGDPGLTGRWASRRAKNENMTTPMLMTDQICSAVLLTVATC